MVYKLLILFETLPNVENCSIPVGLFDVSVILSVKNIGEDVFPGGEINQFILTLPHSSQSVNVSSLPKIPSLPPNESVKIPPHVFHPMEGGLATLFCTIKSNDGEEINLFQNVQYNMGKEWRNLFPIFDYQLFRIAELLENIEKLLVEKKEQKAPQ